MPGSPDELRRRLYAPGATPDDVERYREVVPQPEVEEPAPDPLPRPRRRGPLLAIGGLGAIAVVGGAVLAAQVLGAPTAVPTASASADAQPILPIPAAARAAFTRSLDGGASAGIRRYLYDHPDARPDAIRTSGRLASSEYSGLGPGAIALDPSALAMAGGRMTVLVVLDDDQPFEWRASRIDPEGIAGRRQVVDRVSGSLQAGQIGTATTAYDGGGAPTRLYLAVGEQVRWGAVVIFSD